MNTNMIVNVDSYTCCHAAPVAHPAACSMAAVALQSHAMDDSETPPYRVEHHEQIYRVLGASAQVIMECRDEMSARHYVELLCRAYRLGYKAGFRYAQNL